jgi:formate hydrogenlyase subunit 6/NADH:ubiquinone oxidoreductase subunit I
MTIKIATMLNDVAGALFKGPVTEKYPFERRSAPVRLRGMLLWDAEGCTGCSLCAKDCPANAIEVIIIDKKSKQFEIRYHVDRCTFCAQCVVSCRQGCLSMSNDTWELASLGREPFLVLYGDERDARPDLEDAGEPGA